MPPAKKATSTVQDGFYAVLGMDLVGFSTLSDEEQLEAIRALFGWIDSSLKDSGLKKEHCPWSPGGDGGHLTFPSAASSRRALEVAFGILDRAARYNRERKKNHQLRMGIHLGSGSEAEEFRDGTNFWGHGINTAARIPPLAGAGQVLVSQEYFSILEEAHKDGYGFTEPYQRTVKHDKVLTLRNVHKEEVEEDRRICVRGLDSERAHAERWSLVGSLWEVTRRNYEFLVKDAMLSRDMVPALASAKCLVDLGGGEAVEQLLRTISNSDPNAHATPGYHPFFSPLPVPNLRELLRQSTLHPLGEGKDLFSEGEQSDSVFFLVSGQVRLVSAHTQVTRQLGPGSIIGETALWIRGIGRTGTIKAKTDCLFLKIGYEQYREFIRINRRLEQNIATTIKDRTLGNAIDFEGFFPALPSALKDVLRHGVPGQADDHPACEKFAAGAELDLRGKAYALHSGKVELRPPELLSVPILLEGKGHFDTTNVVGVCGPGDPLVDGSAARVLEEALVVSIPHKVLHHLFDQSRDVMKAWDRIWGERQAEIIRRRVQRSAGIN